MVEEGDDSPALILNYNLVQDGVKHKEMKDIFHPQSEQLFPPSRFNQNRFQNQIQVCR